MTRQDSLKQLKIIPGIGKSIAEDLYTQGFRTVADLKNKNPEEMYNKQCELQGRKLDRCLLYTFRCAVYFATEEKHEPDKLKWWNWKD